MVLRGRWQRTDDHRHSPGTQLRRPHHPAAHERQVARRVRVGNGREVRLDTDVGAVVLLERVEVCLAGGPDQADGSRETALHPGCHRLVHRTGTLTAAEDEQHARGGRKPPARSRGRRVRANVGRRVNRVASVVKHRSHVREEPFSLWETEVHLARDARAEARGETRMAVADVLHDRNAMRASPRDRHTARVATGADDQRGMQLAGQPRERSPGRERATERAPVLPRPRPVEWMQVEQRVGELRLRQDESFHPARRTHKMRPNGRLLSHEGACYGQPGIQMSAGATPGEDDVHRVGTSMGFVAPSPITRSRALPMFARIPVITSERIRFDRP